MTDQFYKSKINTLPLFLVEGVFEIDYFSVLRVKIHYFLGHFYEFVFSAVYAEECTTTYSGSRQNIRARVSRYLLNPLVNAIKFDDLCYKAPIIQPKMKIL